MWWHEVTLMGWLWVVSIAIPGLVICYKGLTMSWPKCVMACQVCGFTAKMLCVVVHITHIGDEILDSTVEYKCDDCMVWASEVV